MSKNSHVGHFGGAWVDTRGDQNVLAGRPHAIVLYAKLEKKVIGQFLRY